MARFDENLDILGCASAYSSSLKLKRPLYTVVDSSNFVEPITLDEFKAFASIDFDTDDLLIDNFMRAARVQSEAYLQRSLGVRTVRFRALECPNNYYLSWGMLDESSVIGDYEVVGDYLVTGGKDIDITYTSTDELVNEETKQGVLILALQLYDNRDRFLSRERETGDLVDLWKEKLKPYKKMSSI